MLDIKFIRQNSERVQRDAINKGYTDVNIEGVLKIDDERKVLSQKIDELRAQRNQISASMKQSGGRPSEGAYR